MVGKDDNVLGVPEQTVSTLAGVSSVYVVENGFIRQQSVEVGQREGNVVEVLSGLKGDETIAASNLNQLVTGTRVALNGEEVGAEAEGGEGITDGGAGGARRGGRGSGQ